MNERIEIGNAVLWHADCREIMGELKRVDCVISDPPYGIDLPVDKLTRFGGVSLEYEWHSVEHAGADWVDLILALDVPTVLFGGNAYAHRLPSHPGWIVWDKQADGFTIGSPAELAWTNCLTNLRMFRLNYRGFTTLKDPKMHPMQKPEALMRWILGLREIPSGVVLDPFMGSGTTGVACLSAGRCFVGIEIDRRYFDLACERIDAVQRQGRLFV